MSEIEVAAARSIGLPSFISSENANAGDTAIIATIKSISIISSRCSLLIKPRLLPLMGVCIAKASQEQANFCSRWLAGRQRVRDDLSVAAAASSDVHPGYSCLL